MIKMLRRVFERKLLSEEGDAISVMHRRTPSARSNHASLLTAREYLLKRLKIQEKIPNNRIPLSIR